jgi:hypothetical protein
MPKSQQQWGRDFERAPVKTGMSAASVAILCFAILSVIGGAAALITLPMRTATGVAERTFNPDAVIANYEWFKRQVQDVKAIDGRLDAARRARSDFEASAGGRETWKSDDRQEWNRLNSIVLGLEGQRTSMVAEYNARTQMANRDLFRTSDLPETLQ